MKTYVCKEDVLNILSTRNSAWDGYQRVLELPPENVKVIKFADWLVGNETVHTYGVCRSMCGRCGALALFEITGVDEYTQQLSPYCPNCGAKMRPGNE